MGVWAEARGKSAGRKRVETRGREGGRKKGKKGEEEGLLYVPTPLGLIPKVPLGTCL